LRRLNSDRPIEFILVWGIESLDRVQRIIRQAMESLLRQENMLSGPHSISITFVKARDILNETALTPSLLTNLCFEAGLKVPCFVTECDIASLRMTQSTLYRNTLCPSLVPECVHRYVTENGLYLTPA
jgi:hypothetical protein